MADRALELSDWRSVNDALRRKELRQALYDEGAVVMADCLLTLHGERHRDRRRLENRLFRREVFESWEHELLVGTISSTLGPFVAAGRADLIVIGYRLAMSLTAHIAGIDHDPGDAAATEHLYSVVKKLSEGATLVHSTRDHDEVRAEVRSAMAVLAEDLLAPAIARRTALIERVEAGSLAAGDLPADVLTTLLRNQDSLDLPADVVLREIAFYLQAGAHSTANALTHTLDQMWTWEVDHPGFIEEAIADRALVQRCMHEALRLLPASPVAWRQAMSDTVVAERLVPEGTLVVLDLMSANRDPSVWGPTADRFDPERVVPDGAYPWGLSFGAGMHACIGQELDGGVLPHEDARLYGTVAQMAHSILSAGGRPDPESPAMADPNSVRRHFSSYPILFGSHHEANT